MVGPTGEIRLLTWSQGTFKPQLNHHLGQGVHVRKAPPRFSFAEIFNMVPVKLNKDHYGTVRGERKWLQHICARCWVDTRFVACHTEFSKECPLAVEKDSNSSGTAAP